MFFFAYYTKKHCFKKSFFNVYSHLIKALSLIHLNQTKH